VDAGGVQVVSRQGGGGGQPAFGWRL